MASKEWDVLRILLVAPPAKPEKTDAKLEVLTFTRPGYSNLGKRELQLPGGQYDPNKDIPTALVAKLRQETGLRVVPTRFIELGSYQHEDTVEDTLTRGRLYLLPYNRRPRHINFDTYQHQGVNWVESFDGISVSDDFVNEHGKVVWKVTYAFDTLKQISDGLEEYKQRRTSQ